MRHTNKIYHIGTATVTRIDEIPLPNRVPTVLYPDLDTDALEEYDRFLSSGSYDPKASTFTQSIHTWLVRFSRHTILIDTGVGNGKTTPTAPRFDHLDLPYLDRLNVAGVHPDQVDLVLLTHLHLDHVGPDLRSVYCEFPEPSRASRQWILSYAAEKRALCFSSHFAETSAGYISQRAAGFQWQFA